MYVFIVWNLDLGSQLQYFISAVICDALLVLAGAGHEWERDAPHGVYAPCCWVWYFFLSTPLGSNNALSEKSIIDYTISDQITHHLWKIINSFGMEKPRGLDERARSTSKKDDFDFGPMQKGITLLKFGSRGPAHEKVFKLSGDKRFITWEGRWISPKLGKRCIGNDWSTYSAKIPWWHDLIGYTNSIFCIVSMFSVDLEKAIRLQAGQMTYKFERLGEFLLLRC